MVEQLRRIGVDPRLQRETFRQALAQVASQRRALRAEQKSLRDQSPRLRGEIDRLVRGVTESTGQAAEALRTALSEAQDRLVRLESRQREVEQQIADLARTQVDEAEAGRALQSFTPIWDVLHIAERERILRLLIESISYDGRTEDLSIAFRLGGLGTLAAEAQAWCELAEKLPQDL